MTITSSFAPCVSLKFRTSRHEHGLPICTLASEHPKKSLTKGADQADKPAYRELPDNLPKSQLPPPPPVHRSVPIVGFFLEKLIGIDTTPREKRQRYGPVYSSNYFIDQRTYICDYHAVAEALRDEDVFRVKGSIEVFAKMFGEGNILSNDFDVHKIARNAILPAFAPALFPQYMSFITKRVNKTWKRVLERHCAGERIKLEPVFRENYVSIIIEMTTGIDMDSKDSKRIPELFEKFLMASFNSQFGPIWNAAIKARDVLMCILEEVVKKNLNERADTINKLREYGDEITKMGVKEIAVGNLDVLTVLIAAEPKLSTVAGVEIDKEAVESVCYLVLILWFAGFSNVASTSMSMSFEMGLDNSIRDRLVAEQDTIVATANGNKDVKYEQLSKEMPLLDSYILEILRIRPPSMVLGRKVAKDIEVFGHFVPKDTLVFFDINAAQRDPNIFPSPDEIVIDRFVKYEGKPKPPAVLTFGAPGSPHYCIGAALAKVMMKTTIATLLRDYSYTLDKRQSKEYRSVPDMSPKSGVVLEKFERRRS